jgi:hypothetical protein
MEIENKSHLPWMKEIFYVVKKRINHRVSAEEECSIMLIESNNRTYRKVKSAITKTIEDQKY